MSPEEVVARYFELLVANRYLEAAGLVSDRYLEHHRKEVESFGDLPTVEELMEMDPELGPEDAERLAEVRARLVRPSVAASYARVETKAELLELSDREILARRLERQDPSTQTRRHFERLIQRHPRFRAQLEEQRESHVRPVPFHIPGSVLDGRWAYVLVVREIDESSPHFIVPDPSVVPLERHGDTWRLAVDPGDLLGFGHLTIVTTVEDDDGEWIALDPDEPA